MKLIEQNNNLKIWGDILYINIIILGEDWEKIFLKKYNFV